MNILGNNITLRSIEAEDLEFLRQMMNDSELENYVLGFSFPISKLAQQKWYEKSLGDSKNQKWIIEYENKSVGVVYLSNIDWKNRNAEVGIKLHSTTPRRTGIGFKALDALEEYVFGQMQLFRLEASILCSNTSSIKLFEKLGWIKEGVLRKSYYYSFQYHDVYVYSLLYSEYIREKEFS